jgi:hypothetical protein
VSTSTKSRLAYPVLNKGRRYNLPKPVLPAASSHSILITIERPIPADDNAPGLILSFVSALEAQTAYPRPAPETSACFQVIESM